jgi:hypothetical protein
MMPVNISTRFVLVLRGEVPFFSARLVTCDFFFKTRDQNEVVAVMGFDLEL